VITIWDPEDLADEVASIDMFDKVQDENVIKQFKSTRESSQCLGVTFSGDDTRLLAVLNDRELRVWNTSDGKLIQRWCDDAGDDPEVAAIASSPDGSVIGIGYVASNYRPLDIVDGTSLKPIATIDHKARIVGSIAFSDNGDVVAVTGNDRYLALYETKSGRELHRFKFKTGEAATCVAFSPDGTKMAAGLNDGTARIWDIGPYVTQTP
jgi:WD40 repeat protein